VFGYNHPRGDRVRLMIDAVVGAIAGAAPPGDDARARLALQWRWRRSVEAAAPMPSD